MPVTAIFTVAEARAFDKAQLANVTTYPTADIEAKEAEIREWLEHVCGVNFIPTTHAETCDGDGSDYLIMGWPKITAVTSIYVDGEALTATDINPTDYGSGLAIDADKGILTRRSGTFTAGWSNVIVNYTAGFATPPAIVKRAALQVLVTELPGTNVPFSAESYDQGGMSYSFNMGDGFNENWHRIPEVRKVIRMYGYKLPGIA